MLRTERDVEAKFLPNLFCKKLGYDSDDLKYAVPVSFHQGREKVTKEADLVIYLKGKPVIVVEAKKPTEGIKSWVNQADSYAFALGTKYSIITNGKDVILRGYYEGNTKINIIESDVETLEKQHWETVKKIISIQNIASASKEKPNPIVEVSSNEITNYRSFFKGLHDVIRDREKLDPAKSFDELSKLLFIKIAESEKGQVLLTPQKIEEFEKIDTEQANIYIQSVFKDAVKKIFPDVFDSSEKIEISPQTAKILLTKLENFSLKDGKQDVKGRAFEEFLPSQLRGKGLGQFFTPRPVVDFMVKMANVSIHDVIVDFSCGSGGFLIKSFESIVNSITQLPSGTWERLGIDKNKFLEDVKAYQLYGIDAEPRATRVAKMNMMLWGDGKRVVRGNGLDIKDKLGNEYKPQEYSKDIDKSGCTLILANPPFGSKESKEEIKEVESKEEKEKREKNDILSRYELGKNRDSQKTEILFIEKGIKLLRPQGRMFIIIPEGIMSNPSYKYVREFIMKNADIKAIISLPTYTFVQSGVDTIKTVILYIEKFTEEKKSKVDKLLEKDDYKDMIDFFGKNEDLSYKIFMGIAEYIGYEPSGKKINSKADSDLDLILKDFTGQKEISADVDVIEFANAKYLNKSYAKGSRGNKISRGVKTNEHISYYLDVKEAEERLDPAYYFFKNNTANLLKNFVRLGDGLIEEADSKIVSRKTMGQDDEYLSLSCTTSGLELGSETITIDTISNQKYKVVKKGDIVYNPYRINIGSIGVVSEETAGSIVSGAYVVFRCKGLNPLFLVNLLKTPFYKLYMNLITTGSIRDNLDYDLLENITIPSLDSGDQLQVVNNSKKYQEKIQTMQNEIKESENKISDIFQSVLKPVKKPDFLPASFEALLTKAVRPSEPKKGK